MAKSMRVWSAIRIVNTIVFIINLCPKLTVNFLIGYKKIKKCKK